MEPPCLAQLATCGPPKSIIRLGWRLLSPVPHPRWRFGATTVIGCIEKSGPVAPAAARGCHLRPRLSDDSLPRRFKGDLSDSFLTTGACEERLRALEVGLENVRCGVIVLQNLGDPDGGGLDGDFGRAPSHILSMGLGFGCYASQHPYAKQAAATGGGARQRNLARRRRFCAVAVSSTSLAPLKPSRRSRSSASTMRNVGTRQSAI